MKRLAAALATIAVTLSAQSGRAQQPAPSSWAVHAINNYQVAAERDLPDGKQLRVEARRLLPPRRDDATADGRLLPWRLLGGRDERRLASAAAAVDGDGLERRERGVSAWRAWRQAPAAVEDALCALRYIVGSGQDVEHRRHAGSWSPANRRAAICRSTQRMIPGERRARPPMRWRDTRTAGLPLAINWFGVTDVYDVIEGPNRANAAMTWFGSLPNREEIAQACVTADLCARRPATDPHRPRRRGSRGALSARRALAHEALAKVGVANQLLTIPKGGHGSLYARRAHDDLRDRPRVPREARAVTEEITVRPAGREAVTRPSGIDRSPAPRCGLPRWPRRSATGRAACPRP